MWKEYLRGGVAPEQGSAILPRMASVLWLDFEGVVVEAGLTNALLKEFAVQPPMASLKHPELLLAAAISEFEAPRTVVEEWVRDHAMVRPGLEDLVGWAQWHGWLPIIVSTAPDLCVETVLEDSAFDRVTRHCGRTQQIYRWRLTYSSPKGIELEEGFLLSYAAALRDAGDLIVYVGQQEDGLPVAHTAYANCTGGALTQALGEGPRSSNFETLEDVRKVLEKEGEAWKSAFATGASTKR
ncbi:MAG: hypothetical protein CL897_00995 [Dehalococcoidia bacterium]|nr:hypothetical protein [Dehalococcoidia bacterium]HCV00655.1 hypothetical protein [Dehalococcoidia bacterium]|tara:strand:- start:11332 stop:12051 length:720 start_codon:yes stop_codon:yes gene_type:complete